ncbi:hypothetical protein AYI69_g4313 [Smittium culicis]|uniref:Uncharacterized protein n=1 Tax=Smittium culicis TaxID=133412 RepID=A0A1R1YER2_9FUNG|nr:hypothetical protein AYI69_g4313 [Smittium culicis]
MTALESGKTSLVNKEVNSDKKHNSEYNNKSLSLMSDTGVGYYDKSIEGPDPDIFKSDKFLERKESVLSEFRRDSTNTKIENIRKTSVVRKIQLVDRIRTQSFKRPRTFYKINRMNLSKSNRERISVNRISFDKSVLKSVGKPKISSRSCYYSYSVLLNGRISTDFSLESFGSNIFSDISSNYSPKDKYGSKSKKSQEYKKKDSIHSFTSDIYPETLKSSSRSFHDSIFGSSSLRDSLNGQRRGSRKGSATHSFIFNVKDYYNPDKDDFFSDILKGKNFQKETLFSRDSVLESKVVDYNYIELRNSRLNSVRDRLELYTNEKDTNNNDENTRDTDFLWEKHINLLNDVFQFFSTALRSFNSHWDNDVINDLQLIILRIVDFILSQGGLDPKRKEWETHYKNILGSRKWNKTWAKLGDELVKPALKISINIWFLCKTSMNENLLSYYNSRLIYWFHRPEVVELWLQLYGQVILRQLRADYGELECVGVEKIKISTPKFKMGVVLSRETAYKMWKFISGLRIKKDTVTLKSYAIYSNAVSQIVKVMASIGKTESQIDHFRKNNEVLLSPPIKYILDLCGNPLMAIISNKKLKGNDFSKARMRITSALSKLMCTEEMSENFNNPINYSLILALDQGFAGDSEIQAILHEAPALIGLNPNARAYYEHMLRSIKLVIPKEIKGMKLYTSRSELRNRALKTLLSILSLPKYYLLLGLKDTITEYNFKEASKKGSVFGVYRTSFGFSDELSSAINTIKTFVTPTQQFFIENPKVADMLVEILTLILSTLTSENNIGNYILTLRATSLFVSEYSILIKGSLKAIITTMIKKIKISQSSPEFIDHALLSMSHLSEILKYIEIDDDELIYCIKKIVNLLSRCDIPIYSHSDYDYAHQRFFVSAKCLFGWISLRTRSKNTDLENLKVGLKIVKRLLGFTTKVNPVRIRVNSDAGLEKSSINNQSQYESDDNIDSIDMDENTFFKKYMEETKDPEEVELIKTSSKIRKFSINKKKNGKIPSLQFISERKDTSRPEKSQSKRLRSSTDIDQMVYKNFVLDEGLKESLNGVIFSLNATLFNNTEAKDLICKFSFQKMLINIGQKAIKSEEIFDVGLDLVIAQKSLLNKGKNVKCDQETSYFYIINDSITSFTKLVPKKSKSLTVPVLITTRNVNGKYSSIISNVNPEHLENRNKLAHHINKNKSVSTGKNDTSNPMRISLKSSEVKIKTDCNNEESKRYVGIEDNYLALSSGEFLNNISRNKSDYNLYKGKLGNERKEDNLYKKNHSCEFIFDNDIKKRKKSIKKPYFLNSIIGIDDSSSKDTGNIPIISLSSGSPDNKSKGGTVFGNEKSSLEEDLSCLFRLSLEKMETEDINIKKCGSVDNKGKEIHLAKREAGNISTGINESIDTPSTLDIKIEKNPTPWVHSARAERLAMSQSKARDARGYSSLSVDMLPKLNDISNTTIMSDLIRKDTEKRTTQINSSKNNNQFKPIQPTSESEIIKNSGNLPSSFLLKPIINPQLHSPIEINEELIRQLTLLDCLDS